MGRKKLAIGLVVFGAIVLVALAVLIIPKLLPKSAEQKYLADQEMIQRAVLAHHTGYSPQRPSAPVTIIGSGQDSDFHRYPTYGVLNRGDQSAMKEEDAGSVEITTLGVYQSNPVGEVQNQAGVPSWEDVDGDRRRNPAADKLFYENASPPPAVDHWNTTTVTTEDGTAYVVDSRDWFINLERLLEKEYLPKIPASVSPDNHANGSGSYSWYVDANGRVESVLYSNPTQSGVGFQDVYP